MHWFIDADNHRLPGEWLSSSEAVAAALRYWKATRAYEPEEPVEDIIIIDPTGKRFHLDVQPAAT